MFFPDKIKSIKENDKVLEIGPGATPYFRSDIFLEKQYDTVNELIAQSGRVGILKTNKQVVTYSGNHFPFVDNEFDYVVCSHVLEHVEDVGLFLAEVQRVAKCGYLEFPTIYYDYLYNFPEHLNFLFYNDGRINWMTKTESGLDQYAMVQRLFYQSCELGYYETIDTFRDYFFQGFEWFDKIESEHVSDLNLITYSSDFINSSSFLGEKQFKAVDYSSVSFWKYLKYRLEKRLIK